MFDTFPRYDVFKNTAIYFCNVKIYYTIDLWTSPTYSCCLAMQDVPLLCSTILTTWNNTYEPKPLAHRSPIYPAHLKSFQRVIRRTILIRHPLTKRIKVNQGDLLARTASPTDLPIRSLPTARLPKHTLHRSCVKDSTGSI